MEADASIDLATLEQKIDVQTDVVARAPSSKRYSEIMHLQMLRDMRELLQDAYRIRCECSEQFRALTEQKHERAPQKTRQLAVVVDANPVTLMHVTDLLEEAGYSVLCAASHANALAWLKQHQQQIGLLYIGLDVVEGYEGAQLACTAAKAWPATAILLSGGVDGPPEDMPSSAFFLSKPFLDEELLKKVTDIRSIAATAASTPGAAELPSNPFTVGRPF